MSSVPEAAKVPPGVVDPEIAARALRHVRDYLSTDQGHADQLRFAVDAAADEALVLPRQAVEMFAYVLAALANGQGIQLMPLNAELTTQQAADLLNVSRPYLIGLLERGEIEYRLVGRHRRVRFEALMAYRRQDDLRTKAALAEMTQLGQEFGGD